MNIKILKRVQYKTNYNKETKRLFSIVCFRKTIEKIVNYAFHYVYKNALESHIVIYKFIYLACSCVHLTMLLCIYWKISSTYCK